MEKEWFIWQTNSDYSDMLRRPIIRTDNQIKKSEEKRKRNKLKRKKLKKIYFIMK